MDGIIPNQKLPRMPISNVRGHGASPQTPCWLVEVVPLKAKVRRGAKPPRFKPRLFSGRPSRSCAVKLSLPRLLPPPRETPRRPTNKPTEAAAQKAPVRRGAKPPRFNDGRLPSPVATAAPTAPPYPTRPRVVASPSGRYPPAKQPEGASGRGARCPHRAAQVGSMPRSEAEPRDSPAPKASGCPRA